MSTFAYGSSVGGQMAFQGITATGRNVAHRGMIHQVITAPGTETVKARGKVSYYANSTQWGGGWVRLDLYNSDNTIFVDNLFCVTFSSNVSWTTSSFGSDVSLTGGAAYTVRVTMQATTRDHPVHNAVITVAVDNIIVNFAPTGLSASAPADTTNASLSWSASTAGSGAPGLHTTTPYKIYRNDSSPVSTFLANATTNSYTDSSTIGNTTYYYAATDIDTGSDESPKSAEVSILTRPDVPGDPTFSNVGSTSIRVNWTAPAGGATSYKVERCTGTSCSDFSQITSGVTNLYYDDSSLEAGVLYRYRIRATNASGNGNYSGVGERTTSAAVSISIDSCCDGSVSLGTVGLGNSANTTASNLNDVEAVLVESGPANLNVRSGVFSDGSNTWVLGAVNDAQQVKWEFSKTGSSWTTFAVVDSLYALDTNVGTGSTSQLYLQLTMPTVTNSYNPHNATVVIVASVP
jgi:fibronectin type 3 domain-containing protein